MQTLVYLCRDIMTDNHTDTDTRTLRQWADMTGKNADSVAKTLRRKTGASVSVNTMLSAGQWADINGGHVSAVNVSPSRTRTAKRVNSTTTPQAADNGLPFGNPKPRKTFRESMDVFRAFALDAILVSVVAGHALLIWYDCAIQWETPGTIGGGLAFAIVAAALLLATDETRARTSGAALYFVLCVDVAAWWVHFPTFQRPGVPDEITGVFAGFLCAASWVALYLYRDKNID